MKKSGSKGSFAGFELDQFDDDDDMMDFGKFDKKPPSRKEISTHDERKALDKADSFLSGGGFGGAGSYGGPISKSKKSSEAEDEFDNLLKGLIDEKKQVNTRSPLRPDTGANSGVFKISEPRDEVRRRNVGGFSGGGDILDQFSDKTPEARPFTSPGQGTGSSKPLPSWLQDTTPVPDRSAEPQTLTKNRPSTSVGAQKPPLYMPSRQHQASLHVDDLNDGGEDISEIMNQRGPKKSTQVTPPMGLANLTGDEDILSQHQGYSRRPFSETNVTGNAQGGIVASRRAQTASQSRPILQNLHESPLEGILGEKKVERLVSQQRFGLSKGPDVLSYQGSQQGGSRVKSLGPLSQGSQRGPIYGGDVLDQEVNSQAGPGIALSGRSSNRRSIDAGDQGLLSIGGQSPVPRRISQQQYQADQSQIEPRPQGGLSDLFTPQMDKTFGDSYRQPRPHSGKPTIPASANISLGLGVRRSEAVQKELKKIEKEKELIEQQIAQEKVQHSMNVQKLKKNIDTSQKRVEMIESQNQKYLQDLRQRHRKDIELLEEQHSKTIQQLIDQKVGLQTEMDKSVKFQRERMQTLHETELLNREKNHELGVQRINKLHQEQLGTLQRQIQQQISANRFLQDVRETSNSLEQKMKTLQEQKDIQLRDRENGVVERERNLA